MLIGYARTSTIEQKSGLDTQIDQLQALDCHKIFAEQVSSVQHRQQLDDALDYVREGDTLVVTKLDRLARSVSHLHKIHERLVSKNVHLKILNLNIDTATPTGKLMMNLMGSIAEFERDMMLERQREGIQKAKQAGRYKGRVPTAMAKSDQIIQLFKDGVTKADIARQLNISRASVYRALAA